MILDQGVAWNGETYGSLSQVAKAMTGTSWNGHRFFGLRTAGSDRSGMVPRRPGDCDVARPMPPQRRSKTAEPLSPDDLAGGRRRHEIGERQNDAALRRLHPRLDGAWPGAGVNSLDNQREASEAYVKSQAHEGWKLIRTHYDDGGYSGGSVDRPALQKLLDDVRGRRIDVIVVYKVDRLTRSLADFAKLVELFEAHQVSFVSVTQAFNTTTSMGRLTLNVLLSFAQFEREVTGERIRDKIAASKRKGIWMGGVVPLGYRVENRALHVVEEHAVFIRDLFRRYLEIGRSCGSRLFSTTRTPVAIPDRRDGRDHRRGVDQSGASLQDPIEPYLPWAADAQGPAHDGLHDPIVDQETWNRVERLLAEHAQRTAGNCRTRTRSSPASCSTIAATGVTQPTRPRADDDGAIMFLRLSSKGRQARGGFVAGVPALEIEARVAEATRAASPASNRQGRGWAASSERASNRGASTDPQAVRPSDYDATLRAAIERVVMSRTTIEIERGGRK